MNSEYLVKKCNDTNTWRIVYSFFGRDEYLPGEYLTYDAAVSALEDKLLELYDGSSDVY